MKDNISPSNRRHDADLFDVDFLSFVHRVNLGVLCDIRKFFLCENPLTNHTDNIERCFIIEYDVKSAPYSTVLRPNTIEYGRILGAYSIVFYHEEINKD